MKNTVIQLPSTASGARVSEPVTFHRRELTAILSVYGRMVAAGVWRDYALDHLSDVAIFSAFRRTSEVPLYRIEKRPKLAQRQGAYAIVGADGRVLKRGRELPLVLKYFDAKLIQAVEARDGR